MDKVIVIAGLTNPQKLPLAGLVNNTLLEELAVRKHRSYLQAESDHVIPAEVLAGDVEFINDRVAEDYYVRHYMVEFQPKGYDEHSGIVVAVMRHVHCPKVVVNIGVDIPVGEQFIAEADDMREGVPRFIKSQLMGKLGSCVQMTLPQIEAIVDVMIVQMAFSTRLPQPSYRAALIAKGWDADDDLLLLDQMAGDVSTSVGVMGIDVLEPNASVSWSF